MKKTTSKKSKAKKPVKRIEPKKRLGPLPVDVYEWITLGRIKDAVAKAKTGRAEKTRLAPDGMDRYSDADDYADRLAIVRADTFHRIEAALLKGDYAFLHTLAKRLKVASDAYRTPGVGDWRDAAVRMGLATGKLNIGKLAMDTGVGVRDLFKRKKRLLKEKV